MTTAAAQTVTGPTDPESQYAGRQVTLRKIPARDVECGMLIGYFAMWHMGGPQPANLIHIGELQSMSMRPAWDYGVYGLPRYKGQEVTLRFTNGDLFSYAGDFALWQVASIEEG